MRAYQFSPCVHIKKAIKKATLSYVFFHSVCDVRCSGSAYRRNGAAALAPGLGIRHSLPRSLVVLVRTSATFHGWCGEWESPERWALYLVKK